MRAVIKPLPAPDEVAAILAVLSRREDDEPVTAVHSKWRAADRTEDGYERLREARRR